MAGLFAGGHVDSRHRAPPSSSAVVSAATSATTLVVADFPLLVGTTEGAWARGSLVALSAVAGLVQALVLRTCHPTTYQRLDAGVPQ